MLYDPKIHGDLCGRFDLIFLTSKVTGSLEVAVTYCMTLKGQGDLCGRFDLVKFLKKAPGSLEVAVTYFMTPNVKVTFVVVLT